jgi:hypothetical protein
MKVRTQKIKSPATFTKCLGIPLMSLFFFHPFLHAQEISAAARVDSTHFLIGQHIRLHIEIHHPPGIVFTWKHSSAAALPALLAENYMPSPEPKISDQFYVVKESAIDTLEDAAGLIEKRTLVLTSFDTGALQIPAMAWYYHDGAQHNDSVMTQPLTITLASVAVDTTRGFRPLKPLIVSKKKSFTAWELLLIPVAGVILWLVYFFLKRRTNTKEETASAQAENKIQSPYEIAKNQLQYIESEKLWQKNAEEYYVRITTVIRDYMQSAMNIAIPQTTARKMIRQLQRKISDAQLLEKLQHDFNTADLVKFAKVKPKEEECLQMLNTAKEFLEHTYHKALNQTSEP